MIIVRRQRRRDGITQRYHVSRPTATTSTLQHVAEDIKKHHRTVVVSQRHQRRNYGAFVDHVPNIDDYREARWKKVKELQSMRAGFGPYSEQGKEHVLSDVLTDREYDEFKKMDRDDQHAHLKDIVEQLQLKQRNVQLDIASPWPRQRSQRHQRRNYGAYVGFTPIEEQQVRAAFSTPRLIAKRDKTVQNIYRLHTVGVASTRTKPGEPSRVHIRDSFFDMPKETQQTIASHELTHASHGLKLGARRAFKDPLQIGYAKSQYPDDISLLDRLTPTELLAYGENKDPHGLTGSLRGTNRFKKLFVEVIPESTIKDSREKFIADLKHAPPLKDQPTVWEEDSQ